MLSDEEYMRTCIEVAQGAARQGNIGVGALVVNCKNGAVVSQAGEAIPHSSNDITAHAEILAVRRACEALESKDLSSFEIYTTAEPCWMCSYAIREAKLKRVVYGVHTDKIGGVTSDHPLLTVDHGTAPNHWKDPPMIVSGVLAEECSSVREASRK